MGVQGLLGSLKSIQKATHVRELAGKTVAVDAYGWLHRGSIACPIELVTGKPTRKFVDFAMHRVRMLQHYGLNPYLVFDGDRLPSKSATEASRHARRAECKVRGLELLGQGRSKEAYQELQKAVDVTPEMARLLIEELRRFNISYLVAPYEADSQMVYLERHGVVDAIVSEDSDLLVFGAKCLITKLDQYGECVVIKRSQFTACREMNLTNWTDSQFRCMAILSGCDYLEGLPRMGIKTAHRYVRKYKTIDRIVRGVQFEGKIKVPSDYLDSFQQADLTFLHQWVFCPQLRQLVNFTPLDATIDPSTLDFIGPRVDDEISRQVALGDLDPISKAVLSPPSATSTTKHDRPMFSSRPSTHPVASENQSLKQSSKFMESFIIKRQPLAELDPNAMQQTASQRRLLQTAQNQRPWSARTAPLSRMVTGSAPLTGATARALVPTHTTSVASHQPKRRRLCMDESSSPSKGDSPSEASPFFAKPVGRVPGKRQQHKSFELWSDDSIEGALRDLEAGPLDAGAQPRIKPPKISIFKDNEQRSSITSLDPTEQATKHISEPSEQPASAAIAPPPSLSQNAPASPIQSPAPAQASPSSQRPAASQVASTPRKAAPSKTPLLHESAFKGSEDALVPESDVEDTSTRADSSDVSEPGSPAVKADSGAALAHKRRHILNLEQFVYGAQPFGFAR